MKDKHKKEQVIKPVNIAGSRGRGLSTKHIVIYFLLIISIAFTIINFYTPKTLTENDEYTIENIIPTLNETIFEDETSKDEEIIITDEEVSEEGDEDNFIAGGGSTQIEETMSFNYTYNGNLINYTYNENTSNYTYNGNMTQVIEEELNITENTLCAHTNTDYNWHLCYNNTQVIEWNINQQALNISVDYNYKGGYADGNLIEFKKGANGIDWRIILYANSNRPQCLFNKENHLTWTDCLNDTESVEWHNLRIIVNNERAEIYEDTQLIASISINITNVLLDAQLEFVKMNNMNNTFSLLIT